MGILLWIIFGALSGWLTSVVMKTDWEQGTLADILLGILGSIIGGFVMGFLGFPGVTGFNVYSILVAVLGGVIFISIGRRLHSY